MANRKTTKRALLTSVLAMLLCIVMLLGTTYAWFTDTVASGRNVIQAGNLDVELYYKTTLDGTWEKVTNNTKVFNDAALYEPGYTQVVYLKVVNEGSLSLKYNMAAHVYSETLGKTKDGADIKLSDYLKTGYLGVAAGFGMTAEQMLNITVNSTFGASRDAFAAFAAGEMKNFEQYGNKNLNEMDVASGTVLQPGEDTVGFMVVSMPTTVGNEANHNGTDVPEIKLGLTLMATQVPQEEDSFGSDYDKDATYTAEIDALRALLTNAQSGDVVEYALSHDAYIDARITVPEGVTLKLNGNGHTIFANLGVSNPNTVLFYAKNADIHLSDLTITGTASYAIYTNGVSWEGGNTGASLTNVTIDMDASVSWYPVNFSGKGNITLTNCTITGEGSAMDYSRNGTHVFAGAEINLTVNGGNVGNVLMNANSGNNSTLTLNDGAIVNKLILATDGNYTAKLTNNDSTINELIQQVDNEEKLRAAITSAKSGDSISVSLYKNVTITSQINVPAGVNLTIYGEGKTITANADAYAISTTGGNIVINDLTMTGAAKILKNIGGNVTMNNVTVDVTSDANYALNFYGGGVVELNNCTVTGKGASVTDVWFGDGRTVTINGGSYSSLLINCSKGAGNLSAGTLTVNNATVDMVYVGAVDENGTVTRANLINNNSTIGAINYEH